MTNMNMDLWIREQIVTQDKKAMPLLSYPAVQQLFITVNDLVNSSSEMALGVRLIADRYNMPFATTYMDLSIEAEAFAGIRQIQLIAGIYVGAVQGISGKCIEIP